MIREEVMRWQLKVLLSHYVARRECEGVRSISIELEWRFHLASLN